MKLGDIVDIAASGLSAQRARMAAAASNIANVNTTRGADGTPYRARDPIIAAAKVSDPFGSELDTAMRRVEIRGVHVDPREPLLQHDPGHPDANAQGMVALPRVNVVNELANVMSASRSYEASLVIVRKVREMAEAALQIGR